MSNIDPSKIGKRTFIPKNQSQQPDNSSQGVNITEKFVKPKGNSKVKSPIRGNLKAPINFMITEEQHAQLMAEFEDSGLSNFSEFLRMRAVKTGFIPKIKR